MDFFRRLCGPNSRVRLAAALAFSVAFAPILLYAIVSPRQRSEWWGYYSQGWPLAYIERQVDVGPKSAWPVWENVTSFDPKRLTANVLIAVALALASGLLWARHVARRRWWQFSLKEILGLFTVLSVGFAYASRPVLERRREDRVGAQLEKMGWVLGGNIPAQPGWAFRPLLDLGLIDPDSFWRIRSLAWEGRTSDSADFPSPSPVSAGCEVGTVMHETGQLARSLKHCDQISICGAALTPEGLDALGRGWGACEIADFGESVGVSAEVLRTIVLHWPRLKELTLSGTDVSDEAIGHVAELRHLTALSIATTNQLSLTRVHPLIQECNSLEFLEVPPDWAADSRFAEFREQCRERAIDLILLSQ